MLKFTTVVGIAGLLALAGCSSSSDSSGQKARSTVTVTVTKSNNASAPKVEGPEDGAVGVTDDGADADAASDPATVKVGHPYTYVDEDEGTQQQIVVKTMECGTKTSLPGGMDDEGNDEPILPEKGRQFCIVTGTMENVGKKPIDGLTGAIDTVTSGDGTTFKATEDDGSAATSMGGEDDLAPGYGSISAINPGVKRTWYGVYEVPKGMTPSYIVVESSSFLDDGPQALLELPSRK